MMYLVGGIALVLGFALGAITIGAHMLLDGLGFWRLLKGMSRVLVGTHSVVFLPVEERITTTRLDHQIIAPPGMVRVERPVPFVPAAAPPPWDGGSMDSQPVMRPPVPTPAPARARVPRPSTMRW